jgi:subtilase family protein
VSSQDVAALSNDVLHVTSSGAIELVLHAAKPTGPSEEADLENLGATIVSRLQLPPDSNLPPAGMIQAWVPYDKVEAAAALPWVVAVTPPSYGATDAITSEGVALHRAHLVQNSGITGAGVRVGVISDGVTNLAASQALNGLPAVTVFAVGTGDEGTAMLEIVHDMAPGAALLFHATGAGVMGHVNAFNTLVANGANVITEDIAFDAQPAFQQGIAAATAEAIAAAGVSVHSSAGNLGLSHAARVLAVGTGGGPDGVTGPFVGCPRLSAPNVVAIAPGGDTTFDIVLGDPQGQGTIITLQWSEPRAIFPTAGQGGFTDLDLFVMDAGLTRCLAASTGTQANGVGDTIEQVTITGMGGTAAKIVVNVFNTSTAVAPPVLDLRWRNAQASLDTPTRAGSLNPDSNYIGLATSAAAVNANTMTIERFSGGGPVQLGSTTICPGGAPGPCTGVAGPGLTAFSGPTWAAADGVSVSGVGGFSSPFFGTSAAAPHAAGCDALVREAIGAPASPVGPIKDRLADTATDIAPVGVDNVTGAGLLDCFAATRPPVQAVLQSR